MNEVKMIKYEYQLQRTSVHNYENKGHHGVKNAHNVF